jgi:hypothetical protein
VTFVKHTPSSGMLLTGYSPYDQSISARGHTDIDDEGFPT